MIQITIHVRSSLFYKFWPSFLDVSGVRSQEILVIVIIVTL
jgi:hypothetical protein